MSAGKEVWLIENPSGPVPLFFCMEMHQGQPVCTFHAASAKALPTREAAITVMDEWMLRAPWKPVAHAFDSGSPS